MKPILELHVSGLREDESLTFRIEPVGPNAGTAGFLEPGRVLDRLGNHRPRTERIVAELARGAAADPARLL